MMLIGMLGVSLAQAQNNPTELWAGYDPTSEPLDVTVTQTWDEGALRFERIFFTGETWSGTPVRVFAYRGAPISGTNLPGMLHIHGGGQAASLDWVRYWAGRGYVAVSHDFAGQNGSRDPNITTDWGTAPANMFGGPGGGYSVTPTPRYSCWYHWILVARRAITLIQAHPKTDDTKIGVFGISVGGTLTWMVAGIDPRVKASVPIYGSGQNTYTFPWQGPADPVDANTLKFRNTLESEAYAPLVAQPMLFMNASNDHHGRLDFAMRTLALATACPMLREVYTPRSIHHIEPPEANDLPLWMDFHLKGTGSAWPASPVITATVQGGIPRLTVTPNMGGSVAEVKIYYGLNNQWAPSRFYRTVIPTMASLIWTGAAPVTSTADTIYAFANVRYASGIMLSTRLIKVPVSSLPGTVASLNPQLAINSMENDEAWFWWLAGTDPLNPTALYQSATGPNGEAGFTHVSNGGFSFATNILGDPQFRSTGSDALLIDVKASTLPSPLTVQVTTTFFQPGEVHYFKTNPTIEPSPISGWSTVRLEPNDLRTTGNNPLPDWSNVNFLYLSGTPNGKAMFRNLRWEVGVPVENSGFALE